MKANICLILLASFFLTSAETDAQPNNQIIAPAVDSLIKEVKTLTKYESGVSIVFGKLENYEWRLQAAYWDSIYESGGGIIIRYPDSAADKQYFCDSISPSEKSVFNKLIDIKKRSTDDILVDLANKNSAEISTYCFLLLCSDDNKKSKKILDHYLYSDAEIWIEECGQRNKQKVRDFMLNRLLTCMFYFGRAPMITEKELKDYYFKIGKAYPLTYKSEE